MTQVGEGGTGDIRGIAARVVSMHHPLGGARTAVRAHRVQR